MNRHLLAGVIVGALLSLYVNDWIVILLFALAFIALLVMALIHAKGEDSSQEKLISHEADMKREASGKHHVTDNLPETAIPVDSEVGTNPPEELTEAERQAIEFLERYDF